MAKQKGEKVKLTVAKLSNNQVILCFTYNYALNFFF